jgi:hypothetical protein
MNVRMTLPWRFPLRHVLRRAPSQRRGPERPIGFCRTQPPRHATVVKRDGVGFHRDYIPPPPTYPQVSAPAVRPARRCKPQLACAFPTNLEPARSGLRVCAGHRPATPEPDDRQNRAVFDTPARYKKEGLRPRFRRSEALSRTRWQVKDSNLRSFRGGFTDHRRQASDQRQCLSPNKLPGVFPTDSRRQPTTAVANRTPMSRAKSTSPSRRALDRVLAAPATV